MISKNKKSMTTQEREWVDRIRSMKCICCTLLDLPKTTQSQAHEIKQGSWFLSLPLCAPCHTGKTGVHGDKTYLRMLKMDEYDLLNETIRRMYVSTY